MTKPKRQVVVVPKEHPLAWQSKLWPHEELIRSMRRGRKTWKSIAAHLWDAYKVRISHQAVRNFLDRASNPKPKRKRTLRGFNPPTPEAVTAPLQAAFPFSEPHSSEPTYRHDPARNKTPDEIQAEYERESERRLREARSKQTGFGPPPNLNE